jgi:hypothetical protein
MNGLDVNQIVIAFFDQQAQPHRNEIQMAQPRVARAGNSSERIVDALPAAEIGELVPGEVHRTGGLLQIMLADQVHREEARVIARLVASQHDPHFAFGRPEFLAPLGHPHLFRVLFAAEPYCTPCFSRYCLINSRTIWEEVTSCDAHSSSKAFFLAGSIRIVNRALSSIRFDHR